MKFKNARKDLGRKSHCRFYLKSKSPFAPKQYKDLYPKGFKIFTFNAGFKKKNDDLLIIVFDKTINVSCKYSLTAMPSAPIIWDKTNNRGKCRALIVNSGNANAYTGLSGLKNIDKYVKKIAEHLSCSKREILVSSTGVIGEQLNPNLICKRKWYWNILDDSFLPVDGFWDVLLAPVPVTTAVNGVKTVAFAEQVAVPIAVPENIFDRSVYIYWY